MIKKILDERTSKLENIIEKFNEEMDIIAFDVNNTDFSETTGDILVRICIADSDENIYNVFLHEKRFKNKELEEILYKNIVEALIECKDKNINYYRQTLFTVIRTDLLALDYIESRNIILDIKNAKEIYNTIIESDVDNFEGKFKNWIFKIGDIKVINILNIIYKLTA